MEKSDRQSGSFFTPKLPLFYYFHEISDFIQANHWKKETKTSQAPTKWELRHGQAPTFSGTSGSWNRRKAPKLPLFLIFLRIEKKIKLLEMGYRVKSGSLRADHEIGANMHKQVGRHDQPPVLNALKRLNPATGQTEVMM